MALAGRRLCASSAGGGTRWKICSAGGPAGGSSGQEEPAGTRLNSGLQPGKGSRRGTVVLEPGAAGRGRCQSGGCSGPVAPSLRVQGASHDLLAAGGWEQLLLSQKRKLGAWESPLVPLPRGFCFPTPRATKGPGSAQPRGTQTHAGHPPSPHPAGTSPSPHTLRLGQDDDVAGEPDIAGGAALQRDGVAVEVVQHLHDGGEAQVLDAALAPLRQRQPQVLRGGARTCYPPSTSLLEETVGGTQGYLGWGTRMVLARCAASSACGSLGRRAPAHRKHRGREQESISLGRDVVGQGLSCSSGAAPGAPARFPSP